MIPQNYWGTFDGGAPLSQTNYKGIPSKIYNLKGKNFTVVVKRVTGCTDNPTRRNPVKKRLTRCTV